MSVRSEGGGLRTHEWLAHAERGMSAGRGSLRNRGRGVPAQRWLFLEINRTERGGLFDDTGTVEFVAHYRDADGRGALHETSRFARSGGAWVYLDGTHDA
ncbi:YchJ family metal-binding protein [Nocardia sp. NBC_00508]|uniref:YchJ family metal-binding protein n=1 Tax=Nocardia sp. NBC_00508 TaxID=2975992 RepID=UPI003FA60BBE